MAGLLGGLLSWLGRRQVAPPPLPPGASASIPADEQAEDLSISAGDLEQDITGTAWLISYRDSKGQKSRRRITVLNLKETVAGDRLIGARCHEAKAYRQFRIDRIDEAVDLATGEVFEAPVTVFGTAPLAGQSSIDPAQHRHVMSLARNGLRVLLLLARADGKLCRQEEQILTKYIEQCAASSGRTFDRTMAIRWLQRQTPDPALAMKSLERMVEFAPVDEFSELAPFMTDIVNADGTASPEELQFLHMLVSTINAIAAEKQR